MERRLQRDRHPVVVRILRQAGLAEQAGSGLPYVRRLWTAAQRPPPTIANDPARKRFEVVFEWGGGVNGGVDEKAYQKAERSLTEQLLGLIGSKPGLRVPEMERETGQSRRTIERGLKQLRDRGLIDFRGAPKTGGYFQIE